MEHGDFPPLVVDPPPPEFSNVYWNKYDFLPPSLLKNYQKLDNSVSMIALDCMEVQVCTINLIIHEQESGLSKHKYSFKGYLSTEKTPAYYTCTCR